VAPFVRDDEDTDHGEENDDYCDGIHRFSC